MIVDQFEQEKTLNLLCCACYDTLLPCILQLDETDLDFEHHLDGKMCRICEVIHSGFCTSIKVWHNDHYVAL